MKAYLDIMNHVLENGSLKTNRTGINTISTFATVFRHDLRNGFPLLTTKKVNLAKCIAEMFAFIRGATNIQEFHDLDCKLWDAWALDDDHYRLVYKSEADVIAELATVLEKSVEEVTDYKERMEIAKEKWSNQFDELLVSDEILALSYEDAHAAIGEWQSLNPTPPEWLDVLDKHGISIYQKETLHAKGDLGPIYGKMWRDWEGIDQLAQIIHNLNTKPNDRRLVISGWNPSYISDETELVDARGRQIATTADRAHANVLEGKMALPPCHMLHMFNVAPPQEKDGILTKPTLNMSVIMRSSDGPVGLPYNIAGYAAYQMIIAEQVGMEAGELVIFGNDTHVYSDQLELLKEQLSRDPKPLPTLTIPDGIDLLDNSTLTLENINRIVDNLVGYDPHPFIKYPVAV